MGILRVEVFFEILEKYLVPLGLRRVKLTIDKT
jgi:hypothetical protein